MRLGLSLGVTASSGGAAPPSTVTPSPLSTDRAASSSTSSNSVSVTSVALPAGTNRRAVVFLGHGGNQGVSDASCTMTASTGSPAMTKVVEQGSAAALASSFESCFFFEVAIPDAATGTLDFAGSVTHTGTATRMFIAAFVIEAGSAPDVTNSVQDTSPPASLDITPSGADSLVVGCLVNSTDTSSIAFAAGLTQLGADVRYGDAAVVGTATQGASALTITSALGSGREAIIAASYAVA